MSNILEQFKQRKKNSISGSVKVPFPSTEPELELEIQRVPFIMERKALNKGFVASAEAGTNAALVVERAEMMLGYFKKHIIGWKVLKEGWAEYSEQEKTDLLDYIDTGLMLDLVRSYDAACADDVGAAGEESRPD